MPKRKKTEGRNGVDLATELYSNPNANLVSFERAPSMYRTGARLADWLTSSNATEAQRERVTDAEAQGGMAASRTQAEFGRNIPGPPPTQISPAGLPAWHSQKKADFAAYRKSFGAATAAASWRKLYSGTEYEDPKDDLVSFERKSATKSASPKRKPKSLVTPKNSMIADMVLSARSRESKTGANISSDFNKMHRQVLELTEHVESKGAFKKVPEADKEKTEGLGRAVGRLQIEGPSGKTAAQRIINRMGEPDATEGPYETPEWLTKLASTKNITPKGSYLQNPEATKILKTLSREQQQTLALSNIYAAKGSDKSMKEYHTGKDYRKGLKGLYAKGIKGTPSLKNTASVKRAMEKLHPQKKKGKTNAR